VTHEELRDRFDYVPGGSYEQESNHKGLVGLVASLAHGINSCLPDGRAKSIAMTYLEDAMMWVHRELEKEQQKLDNQKGENNANSN